MVRFEPPSSKPVAGRHQAACDEAEGLPDEGRIIHSRQTAGVGTKVNFGPVKLGAAGSVTSEARVDGTEDKGTEDKGTDWQCVGEKLLHYRGRKAGVAFWSAIRWVASKADEEGMSCRSDGKRCGSVEAVRRVPESCDGGIVLEDCGLRR